MKIRSITEVKNLSGKRVLVRADFNVPILKGKVKDDFKIQKTIPTIEFLVGKGARVVLMSHLGRPKGMNAALGLRPVAAHFQKAIGVPVRFIAAKGNEMEEKKYFDRAQKEIEAMEPGEIVMLENVRFIPGEENNAPKVARALAALADLFVLDGFAVAHRDSASVSGVTKFIPGYAGLLLSEEIGVLSKATKDPHKPLVVVLGGAKVETKIPVLKYLLSKADYILVGGQIANTYLWAKGYPVGASLVGKEFKVDVLKYCSNKKVIVPVDFVVGTRGGKKVEVKEVNARFSITDPHCSIFDIGPLTVRLFAHYIKKAQTLIWNGAMGVFETHPYEYGTYALADLFAARSKGKAFGVVGGGETVEVVKKRKLADQIDLVSTGGGAMLEFLSGKELPGLKALEK